MVVYVSSPYAAFLKEFGEIEGRVKALKIARAGCRKVLEMGHLPLSPVLACDGVYDEATQRNEALNYSLEMLKWCDGVLFVRCAFSALSVGMILEENLANELKKPIQEFEFLGDLK